MEHTETTAADGTPIPLNWHPANSPQCSLLLLPALGIQARLYDRLGEQLAAQGCATCIMEQRGHGRSPVNVGRGTGHTLGDFLDYDIPAALEWMNDRVPDQPRLIGGHSLGGHLSTLYAGQQPDRVAGVVHLACAFPYHADYAGKQAKLIRLICSLMPFFAVFPGYFPGHRLGFGGRESLAMMRQWAQWASTGSFDFGTRTGLAEPVSHFNKPVISVSFEQDDFATLAATERALSPFSSAQISRVELGETEQGEFLGHTGWARNPHGVSQTLSRWIARSFAISRTPEHDASQVTRQA